MGSKKYTPGNKERGKRGSCKERGRAGGEQERVKIDWD